MGSLAPEMDERTIKPTWPGAGKVLSAVRPAPPQAMGEVKSVTVLFADIAQSTRLVCELPAEEVFRLLDPVIAIMRRAVQEFGGTVTSIEGDGIMAVFGAPRGLEDHAVRACTAALALQKEVSELGRPELAVRVGIHSGEVVTRTLQTDFGLDFTVIGAAVHLASRIEHLAPPGRILISDSTAALGGGYITLTGGGLRHLRGLEKSVFTHELVGTRTPSSRWSLYRGETGTPFAGRETELEVLLSAARAAQAGNGCTVFVEGAPGIGKSRLISEIFNTISEESWELLEVGGIAHTEHVEGDVLARLLRRRFGVTAQDGQELVRLKVEAGLGELDPADDGLSESIVDLVLRQGQPEANEGADGRDRSVLARLLGRFARRRPTILIVEDLQWMDRTSLEAIRKVDEADPTLPILIVGSARRTGYGWQATARRHVHLHLQELECPAAFEMLEGLLGAHANLSGVKRQLWERFGGVPLFLEEAVRVLADSDALTGTSGNYRPSRDYGGIVVPETIRSIVTARIDSLSPALKLVLQVMCVLRRDAPVAVLARICGLEPEELTRHLGELEAEGLVVRLLSTTEPTFAFRHHVMHEILYGALPEVRRRALHLSVLETLRGMDDAGAPDRRERLAYHAMRACG